MQAPSRSVRFVPGADVRLTASFGQNDRGAYRRSLLRYRLGHHRVRSLLVNDSRLTRSVPAVVTSGGHGRTVPVGAPFSPGPLRPFQVNFHLLDTPSKTRWTVVPAWVSSAARVPNSMPSRRRQVAPVIPFAAGRTDHCEPGGPQLRLGTAPLALTGLIVSGDSRVGPCCPTATTSAQ
jgi:hypothetical protein